MTTRPTAAAAACDRGTLTAGHQHSRDRIAQIEVFACHAVDVLDRDLFDSHEVLIRRAQAIERHRIGPDVSQAFDRVLLKFRLSALLQLGCIDQLRRHAIAHDLREYRAQLLLQRFVIRARRKLRFRIGEAGLRERIEDKARLDRLALRYQSVESEAVAAEHIGQHFKSRKIRAVQSRNTHGQNLRAGRTVGIDGDRECM